MRKNDLLKGAQMASTERADGFLTDDDWDVLCRVCESVGVEPDIVEKMIVAENRVYGMGRRHGILESLEKFITDSAASRQPTREETR
jgi:hypothetical protein